MVYILFTYCSNTHTDIHNYMQIYITTHSNIGAEKTDWKWWGQGAIKFKKYGQYISMKKTPNVYKIRIDGCY